jgi:hypothetical protein
MLRLVGFGATPVTTSNCHSSHPAPSAMMSPANYDVVPPDRTGWTDPAGRLTDPDSHRAGRVGHLLYPPDECGALGGTGSV